MSTYTLDTSFLCAFFNDKDANNKEANKIAMQFSSSSFVIPDVVIAEIVSFSKNPALRNTILDNVLSMTNKICSLSEGNILDYIKFAKSLRYSFTAIDSIVLFLAKESDSELITLDKKLLKQYKNL